MSLSHFNKKNKNIEMVDISKKNKTKRFAEARSLIQIDKKLYLIIIFFLKDLSISKVVIEAHETEFKASISNPVE